MTPKEKAEHLVELFIPITQWWNEIERDWYDDYESAKGCALICCDQLKIATANEIYRPEFTGIVYDGFWDLVKEEIEKL